MLCNIQFGLSIFCISYAFRFCVSCAFSIISYAFRFRSVHLMYSLYKVCSATSVIHNNNNNIMYMMLLLLVLYKFNLPCYFTGKLPSVPHRCHMHFVHDCIILDNSVLT